MKTSSAVVAASLLSCLRWCRGERRRIRCRLGAERGPGDPDRARGRRREKPGARDRSEPPADPHRADRAGLGRRSARRRSEGDHAGAAAAHVARRGDDRSDALEQARRAAGARAAGHAQPRSTEDPAGRAVPRREDHRLGGRRSGGAFGRGLRRARPGARGRGRPAPRREGGQPDQGGGQPAGPAGGEVRRGLALRPAPARDQLLPSGRGREVRRRRHQSGAGDRRVHGRSGHRRRADARGSRGRPAPGSRCFSRVSPPFRSARS